MVELLVPGRLARGVRRIVFLTAVLVAAGCGDFGHGGGPPEDALYLPIGLATSLDGRHVYVLSSNFDQRFRSGWITTLDLEAILAGETKAAFVGRLLVPSLGGMLARSADGSLLLTTARGEGRLVVVEVDDAGRRLSCGDPNATSGLSDKLAEADCDETHLPRLRAQDFDADLTDDHFADPYAVELFDWQPGDAETAGTWAIVGQLRTPWLALLRVVGEVGGRTLQLERSFALNRATLGGVGALSMHPASDRRRLVAGSRRFGAGSVGATLYGVDLEGVWEERPSEEVVTTKVLSTSFGAGSLGGLAYDAEGRFLFATLQGPGALLSLDAAEAPIQIVDELGGAVQDVELPAYSATSARALSGLPSGVVYLSRGEGKGLVFVGGLEGRSVRVFGVRAGVLSEAGRVDDVGEGPFSLRIVRREGRELLLVTTFYDHGLSVIDVTGENPLDFAVVARVRSEELDHAVRP